MTAEAADWHGLRVVEADDPVAEANRVAGAYGVDVALGWRHALEVLRRQHPLALGAAAIDAARARRDLETAPDPGSPPERDDEEVDRLVRHLREAHRLIVDAEANVEALRAQESALRAEIDALGELPEHELLEVLAADVADRLAAHDEAVAAVGDPPEAPGRRATRRRPKAVEDPDLAAWAQRRAAADAARSRLEAAEVAWFDTTGTPADQRNELLERARRRLELGDELSALINRVGPASTAVMAASAAWGAALADAGLAPHPPDRLDDAINQVEATRADVAVARRLTEGPTDVAPDDAEREATMRAATRALARWTPEDLEVVRRPLVVALERSAAEPPVSERVLAELARRAAHRPVVVVSADPRAPRWGIPWTDGTDSVEPADGGAEASSPR